MDNQSFRHYGHAFIDWLADYYEQIESYPVKSQMKPGALNRILPESAPQQPESMEQIFEDFKSLIMPGISHWQHPGWFAYFPANNSPASVLAEVLTAGLGVQGMIWETSPAATELEDVVMRWLVKMLGLPSAFTGVIQDTASTASLCALLTAREKTTNWQINQKGSSQNLRVYTSTQTHSSIEKGVKIAGFGRENLCYIPVDPSFALIPGELEKAIKADIAQGYTPCCVVATLGSTSSMAMDPIEAIADICQKYQIWLHVDAAFAGTAALVPEHRDFMRGVERADSFLFNPHKWMLTNFDCTAYFVQDPDALKRTFSILPEYLKTASDNQVNNYRDWGIPLGRRFRALKLWFVLRSYGIEGIQAMVRKHVALANTFADWVASDPRFELLAPVNLSLVCFRYTRPGLSPEDLNALNQQLLQKVNADGSVFLSHTVLQGNYCIRLSIGQRTTEMQHIEKAWQLIRTLAE